MRRGKGHSEECKAHQAAWEAVYFPAGSRALEGDAGAGKQEREKTRAMAAEESPSMFMESSTPMPMAAFLS